MTAVKYETGSWHDFITSYQVFSQHQKVAEHRPGGGDYGLGHEWYYCCGAFLEAANSPVWYVVFVKVDPHKKAELESLCCDSRLGCLGLIKNPDDSFGLRMTDDAMIANRLWVKTITDVPEQLAYMLGENPNVEEFKSLSCST